MSRDRTHRSSRWRERCMRVDESNREALARAGEEPSREQAARKRAGSAAA